MLQSNIAIGINLYFSVRAKKLLIILFVDIIPILSIDFMKN